MKRRRRKLGKKFITTALIIAIALIGAAKFPEVTEKYAKFLYKSGDYTRTLSAVEFALCLNPESLELYYIYAKTLDSLPMSYDVQKKLFKLAHSSKSGAAASIANSKIHRYRYFILQNAGPNYIEQTPYDGKILRWDEKTFPLKVYVEKNSALPEYYYTNVKKAFNSWSSATNNYIKFQFIDSEPAADIVFKFVEKDNSNCIKPGQEECKYVLAYAVPTISGGKLKKFDISFSQKDLNRQYFSPKDILLASMHEIGHSLGIMGHSFNEDNLMYPSNVEENPFYSRYRARTLSVQDVNTVRLLYGMFPGISNGSFSDAEKNKLIYPPIILGTEKEVSSAKLEQAKKYIKSAPNLPNGYVDLAVAYYELGNYQEAINNLYRAYLLSSNNHERYPLLYNLAVTYFEGRDYDHALQYAQMAANIAPKNGTDINSLIAYLKYKLGSKNFATKELEALISQYPNEIEPSYYLIRLYLEEKNFFEAGKVLKNLKNNNPEAKDDPRIAQFKVLNTFFD